MNNPVLIYLAGPIDGTSAANAKTWREGMAEIAPVGVAFFSPAHAFINASRANFQAVEYANRTMIMASHAVLANLAVSGRAFGTIREIEFARAQGKPVVLVQDPSNPLQSLMVTDLIVCDNMGEALDQLLSKIQHIRETPSPLFQILGLQGDGREEPDDE